MQWNEQSSQRHPTNETQDSMWNICLSLLTPTVEQSRALPFLPSRAFRASTAGSCPCWGTESESPTETDVLVEATHTWSSADSLCLSVWRIWDRDKKQIVSDIFFAGSEHLAVDQVCKAVITCLAPAFVSLYRGLITESPIIPSGGRNLCKQKMVMWSMWPKTVYRIFVMWLVVHALFSVRLKLTLQSGQTSLS